MSTGDEKSRIDKLNESLYSRTSYEAPNDNRRGIESSDSHIVSEDFNSPDLDTMLKYDRRKTENHPVMKKLFTFALIFFVAAVSVAGYVYFGGSNLISSKNVDISVSGPISVSAGEPIEFGIIVSNKNNVNLTVVNMVIRYPENTRSANSVDEPLDRDKVSLGEVAAGSSVTHTARASIFGQKGETKSIIIDLDYQVKGSNATFTKEKIYDVNIGSSPVTMTVSSPPSVASGDIFTTTLTILANSSEILKNVLIKGEYPYGFALVDSDPKAVLNNNIWRLGDLSPGDKRVITIKGRLMGENQEERTFRFYSGVASLTNENTFDVPLAFLTETVGINRSSLGLSLRLNGSDADSINSARGKNIQGSISYKNNMPSSVLEGKIQVRFSGESLDEFSVLPQNGGFYNSTTNTITWDSRDDLNLASLAPGEGGSLSFSFAPLLSPSSGTANSEISLSTTFTASPQNTDSTENLTAVYTNSVKLSSEVTLGVRSLYSRGPFKNSGPIPPRVEKPTTYTIALDLSNTENDISDSKVTMTLGPNVTWLNKVSPTTEKITYNKNTNTITWDSGTISAGAGSSVSGKEIFFQVSLNPSIGQIGNAPLLVQSIEFTGRDSFAGTNIHTTIPDITTRISTDPSYSEGDEVVVK